MKSLFLSLLILLVHSSESYAQIGSNLSRTNNLSDDPVLSSFISNAALSLGININHHQLSTATVGSYNGIAIRCVELSDDNALSQDYVAYFVNDSIVFLKIFIIENTGLPTTVRFESLNGSTLFFSFDVNSSNKVGNIQIGEDLISSTLRVAFDDKTCIESTSNFTDCMKCAYKECYSDWLCALACSIGGVKSVLLCSAGFALACALP